MKFHSLGQYFYKLYSIIFLLLLVPLSVFIILYQGLRLGVLITIELSVKEELLVALVISLALSIWLVASYRLNRQVASIQKRNSLGEKLSQYASHLLKWNALMCLGMLFLAAGYYFTENKWITIVFLASLLLPVLRLPFPSRACRDLALKGDEKMIVLYRMDSY